MRYLAPLYRGTFKVRTHDRWRLWSKTRRSTDRAIDRVAARLWL